MMTGTDQIKVQKLHKAIQAKNVDAIKNAGGLETQSGIPITVGTVGEDDKKQLTFSIKFPAAWWHAGYYTAAKHNSKADLLFQAALVRGTGAKTIVTNINHTNPTIATQLAREAFEAALEIGYQRDEITIKKNGAVIAEKDLFVETLDLHHPGQGQPQVNVDKSQGLANLVRQGEDQIKNPTDPNPQKHAQKQQKRQQESREAQDKMKRVLEKVRPPVSPELEIPKPKGRGPVLINPS